MFARYINRMAQRQFCSAANAPALMTHPLLLGSPGEFVKQMKEQNITRAYMYTDPISGRLAASHPLIQELADQLEHDRRDYLAHEAIFMELGRETEALLMAVIHKTSRGPGAGGVRYWHYDSLEAYLRDGLRLSVGMGRKNALADLWWGGGKGVILREEHHNWTDRTFRDRIFQDYGRFMTGIRGSYVTAEDLGATTTDMGALFSTTRFTTCIPKEVGGSGNPSIATGHGVVCAMEAALAFNEMGEVQGKTFAVQGAGNVARYMMQRLLELGAKSIKAVDVDQRAIDETRQLLEDDERVELMLVEPGDQRILSLEVDVVAPCAVGGTLNGETIHTIRAPIVAGAANNQLLSDEDANLLMMHDITYVPDFLANRMGIVNCSNEQYGYVTDDPAISRHFGREWSNSIFNMTGQVLQLAQDEGLSTAQAANKIADELAEELHPIWPDRSRQIIKGLIKDEWHLHRDEPAV